MWCVSRSVGLLAACHGMDEWKRVQQIARPIPFLVARNKCGRFLGGASDCGVTSADVIHCRRVLWRSPHQPHPALIAAEMTGHIYMY